MKNSGTNLKRGMLRRGETYSKNGISLMPFMIGSNSFVDVYNDNGLISLTKQEFHCLKSGIHTVRDHYDFLKLLVIDSSDNLDIPFPSHIYANNVLELSDNCFLFTTHHNNKLVVCLKKNSVVCELSETIFHIEFHVVQHMLDILAINYQKNWCFYCDQHKSLKHCVVCADGTF